MALRKKSYSKTQLCERSATILERLEQTDLFQAASHVALYHALPGEVQTAAFIEKWHTKKTLYLPVVEGNDLRLLPYRGNEYLKTGSFGILEPTEEAASGQASPVEPQPGNGTPSGEGAGRPEALDLIIVPGVAFDRKNNRLGRGKGYYDRLLSTWQIPKIGICFDFQLFDEIPAEPFDRKMNLVISENETTPFILGFGTKKCVSYHRGNGY